MSWDVTFRAPNGAIGPKDGAREALLAACEKVTGRVIPRRGPTEVDVDPSFQYAVYFSGHKRAVEAVSLAIQIRTGDPHSDPAHPIWAFLTGVAQHTGWQPLDTFTGKTIGTAT